MIPDPLRPVSLHTALLESIAERFRRDNSYAPIDHLEALDLLESLQDRVLSANGVEFGVAYHVKKIGAEGYRIRFDARNDCIEACLDAAAYDLLDGGDIHARATAVYMFADLLLRFRRITGNRRSRNWRTIDGARTPEAKKLADAMLVPALGIHEWQSNTPAITVSDIASLYGVTRATADRRLKLFNQHQTMLLTAAETGARHEHEVRLRPPRVSIVRRAIDFLVNGD